MRERRHPMWARVDGRLGAENLNALLHVNQIKRFDAWVSLQYSQLPTLHLIVTSPACFRTIPFTAA
eukprot:3165381-Pleurochrysis_carterae.AAC.1